MITFMTLSKQKIPFQAAAAAATQRRDNSVKINCSSTSSSSSSCIRRHRTTTTTSTTTTTTTSSLKAILYGILILCYHYDTTIIAAASASSSSSSSSLPPATPSGSPSDSDNSNNSNNATVVAGMILRIRQADGSITKLQIPPTHEKNTTLARILQPLGRQSSSSLYHGNQKLDTTKTPTALNLSHGSLLTIKSPITTTTTTTTKRPKQKQQQERYDPFPSLAKPLSYTNARRRIAKTHLSYSDISKLSSYMHVVDTTPAADGDSGHVKRIYVCHASMNRFRDACVKKRMQWRNNKQQDKKTKKKKTNDGTGRMGLLFGISSKERIDDSISAAATSLSTPLTERDYCRVVKVHAIYDCTNDDDDDDVSLDTIHSLSSLTDHKRLKTAVELAERLGLVPVGWIVSHSSEKEEAGEEEEGEALSIANRVKNRRRNNDDDDDDEANNNIPLVNRHLTTAAKLQILNMKRYGRDDKAGSSSFVTLCMDVDTGVTEAFQLSDVTVQMMAEGVIRIAADDDDDDDGGGGGGDDDEAARANSRFVSTNEPVKIDGREVRRIDVVLCLINTALLSHDGLYAGVSNGKGLTTRVKKNLLKKLLNDDDDGKVLEMLSDYKLLMGLNNVLGGSSGGGGSSSSLEGGRGMNTAMDDVCRLVVKYSRGQKKGTVLGQDLRMLLQSVLGG